MTDDATRDERGDLSLPDEVTFEEMMRTLNQPGAPDVDPVRARLGPNFTPTPFGYDIQEITVGDDGEQGVLLTFSTVCGRIAVVMKRVEAGDLGRALMRYGTGLTVVE